MADELSGWKRSAAQMGVINLGMQIFLRKLIKYGFTGFPFNAEIIEAIKQQSIVDLKNTDVSGLKIEDEADLLREGFENFEKMLDVTITEGRKIE
jgi:hypothetical protein